MKTPYYTICYRNQNSDKGPIMKHTVSLPGIKSLAKFMNKFKRNNPKALIIIAYLSDSAGKVVDNVKFLKIEYKAQRWLVGYKERLLATAVDRGYELKWNHGLKEEV